MQKRSSQSNREAFKAMSPKGESITSKHVKTTAHKPVERRVSNKGRG